MKKCILLILAMFAVVVVEAQTATLSGTFVGLPEGTRLILNDVQGNKIIPSDSLVVPDNGKYSFTVSASQPRFVILTISNMAGLSLHVFLMPNERVVMDMRTTPITNHVRITNTEGSRNMELYRRFNNLIPVGQDDAAQWTLKQNVSDLIKEYQDCLMSAFLVTFFEDDFAEYGWVYKMVSDALSSRYPDNSFVRYVNEKLRTAVVPGMEAPEVALPDINGKERKLSDLRGKIVLLDFWASWCGPCRKENPNVVKIYNKFHAQGFEVFSVSLDNSKDRWTKAIADDGLLWENHVSDLKGWSSAGARPYGVSSIPATGLIDRDGKVVARNLRGADLEAKVRELISK